MVKDQVKLVLLLNSILLEWLEMVVWMVFVVHKNICAPALSMSLSDAEKLLNRMGFKAKKNKTNFVSGANKKLRLA